jgi:hypothetical protein
MRYTSQQKLITGILVSVFALVTCLIHSSHAQETTQVNINNYIGVGFGFATGDVTLLEIPPLVSASYTHSFSSLFLAELSYSYLGTVSVHQSGASNRTSFGIGSLAETSMAAFGQMSLILAPIQGASGFRIGSGISLRSHKYAYFDQIALQQDDRISYLIDYRLGVHGLVEYQIASLERCSLHLRGQFAWFFPAFAGNAFILEKEYFNFPQLSLQEREEVQKTFQSLIQVAPYTISLGAFLRIGF